DEGRLIVLHEVEIAAEGAGDELFEIARPDTLGAQTRADAQRRLILQRLKHLFLRLEVIVEGPGRELGGADDVAHRRRAVAEIGKDVARCVDDRLPVRGFRLFALAARFAQVGNVAHAATPGWTGRTTRGGTGSTYPCARARLAPRANSFRRSYM